MLPILEGRSFPLIRRFCKVPCDIFNSLRTSLPFSHSFFGEGCPGCISCLRSCKSCKRNCCKSSLVMISTATVLHFSLINHVTLWSYLYLLSYNTQDFLFPFIYF